MDPAADPGRYWVHDVDPFFIELWDNGPIRWYGLAYVVGFFCAWGLILRVLRAGRSPIPATSSGDLVMALALGAVLGGRVGYVLFYQPSLLWTFSSDLPFWGLLALNQGGMSSHGGMIGVLLACAWFARRKHAPTLHVLDIAGFAAPLGLFFGRLANFVNGELYGRPTDVPWAVRFPQELYTASAEELREVARAVDPLLGGAPLDGGDVRSRLPEILDVMQQGNEAVTRAIAPFLTPRHPSQLYEAVLEGLLVFAVLAFAWRKPQKPGVIIGLFGVVYSAARVLSEFFREPDAHIAHLEYAALHITRGQWLSVGLALAGVALLVVARRSDAPALGGWRSQRKGEGDAPPRA